MHWRRKWQPTPVFLPGKSHGPRSLVGCRLWGRTELDTTEGNGTPLQYSCLENPMDGGAWWAAVHGVAKSRSQLSDFPFTFHFHALEKEMATCSSVLAWKIPGTVEPDGLPSMGSHRVGHDCSDLAAAAVAEHGSNLDVHRVGDAIQPSHPLSSPSPPAPNPSQHQSLFQ